MNTIFRTDEYGETLQFSKIVEPDGWTVITITDTANEEYTPVASGDTSADVMAQLIAMRDKLNEIIESGDIALLPDDPIETANAQARRAAKPQTKPKAEPVLNINIAEWQIDNGYVGALGHNYKPVTPEQIEPAIIGAMNIMGKTRPEIIEMLNAGQSIKWCKSPNYYYDHSYGMLYKPQKRTVEMVECSCGCIVEKEFVMMASLGTSCPDCYDRMSN